MRRQPVPPPRGFSLVMVLLLLAALALGTAQVLGLGAGSARTVAGYRAQDQALQAAQAALRHCETLLLLPATQRPASWQPSALLQGSAAAPAWTQARHWQGAGLALAPPLWPLTATSTATSSAPMSSCLVERQAVGAGEVFVVTARGLSPQARLDAAGVRPASGQAVWLQSIVLLSPGPSAQVVARTQRRLLQPQIR